MARSSFLVLSILLLSTSGCRTAKKAPVDVARSNSAFFGVAGSVMATTVDAGPKRFIAVRHKLELLSTDSALPKSWQAVIDFCGTIQCDVVTSSITAKTSQSVPVASLALRVAPWDLSKLLAFVDNQGTVVQHSTESEDKTAAVVDTEAKLKNLTAFRDNLRAMLSRPSTVKDSVEIQAQLTNVQSQLDSETAQRKILADETEKVAVEINFKTEVSIGHRGAWARIAEGFGESGEEFGDSVAALIEFIVSIIPWLILIIPGIWLIQKAWRQFRNRKRIVTQSPAAS